MACQLDSSEKYRLQFIGGIVVDVHTRRLLAEWHLKYEQANSPAAQSRTEHSAEQNTKRRDDFHVVHSRLTKKAEPPPTRDGNRDSGTDRANGGWLRRLVRRQNRRQLKSIVLA